MLQQILKDMYIDPDVLEALNEEQKKTLFLKMRQEQVRRWKEREDKLEREGGAGLKPKHTKATRKSVSWLLGRDGDVQVCVIGEVDEVRSSKFIYSELGQVKVSSPQSDTRNQSSTIKSSLVKRPCPENEKVPSQSPGIQLQFKAPQSEQHSAPPEDPEEEEDDDDSSVWESGLLYRPHLRQDSIKSISARLRPLSTLRTELSSADILRPREAHRQSQAGKDIQPVPGIQREGTEGDGPILEGCIARGRVAELMKAFSKPIPKQDTLSRPRKPPIPSKPAHLLFASPNPR